MSIDFKKMLRVVSCLGLLVCSGIGQSVKAEDYVLDDQHTSVVFAVSHLGYSFCYGMFGKYNGKMTFDPKTPAASKFQFSIDAASLDTKSAKRDEHLRGPDFFNVKQFPEITFVSKSVEAKDKVMNVAGTLTLHGVSKSIVLPLTHMGSGPGPDQKQHVGFSGKLVVKRSEFDMKTFLPNIGDEVTLLISFEGVK
jgi:polyisoprenoid-binding protein YceI